MHVACPPETLPSVAACAAATAPNDYRLTVLVGGRVLGAADRIRFVDHVRWTGRIVCWGSLAPCIAPESLPGA